MNKTELIYEISRKTRANIKTTTEVVNSALETITEHLLNNDRVQLTNFGTFEHVIRKGRFCKSLETGKEVFIPSLMTIKFKPCQELKKEIKTVGIKYISPKK